MIFSSPQSGSVLWTLSEGQDREMIEQAHRCAVLAATTHLEGTAGWARRGRGGATRERTAGLLMAQFDHRTSRESDPRSTPTPSSSISPRTATAVGSLSAVSSTGRKRKPA